MLAVHRVRQPTGQLIFSASRAAFASAPQAKPLEKRADTAAAPSNYPGFYDTANVERQSSDDLARARVATGSSEPVPSNDLLEATRTSKPRASGPAATATSTEKFAAGYSPLIPTSSLASTGRGLFQDAKTLNTPVSPGTPVAATSPVNAEHTLSDERAPPSSKAAFLRSISFGLPLFPAGKNAAAPVSITTTREHFLPLTRPSLIRLLATDSSFIDGSKERLLFHQLCQGFDSAVVQRYYPVLNELKGLFDPLNPDNETIDNRRVAYRDRLDNEYWLLQKINDLLHRANFTELPRHVLLDKFILHQDATATSNLNIKIDGYDYDVLKFWVLGREQMPAEPKSRWRRLFRKNTTTSPRDYFKRVVLAVRLKGHDRLYLKAFRDIPLASLTQLLPTGKLQIGNFEQQLLRLTALVGAGTIVTHLLTAMASYQIPGLLVGGGGLTVLLGLGSLRSFYQAKSSYLAGMNRILFYKNVASNKQLLAMIVDRAEDELSKEVLLVYMFILRKQKEKGDLTKKNLELDIENWIRAKANAHVSFSSDQSLEFLRKIGVLLPDDATRPAHLQVLPFEHVVSVLPKVSRTLSEKADEWDLVEGYDKKHFEFDWKTVVNEDKLLHKGGWQ